MEYEAIKQDLRRSYDAAAETRERMDDTDWKRAERSRFADRLREAGSSTLLEIGAGHGVSGRYFADEGAPSRASGTRTPTSRTGTSAR